MELSLPLEWSQNSRELINDFDTESASVRTRSRNNIRPQKTGPRSWDRFYKDLGTTDDVKFVY